nr:hypothetical protein [Streptomyces seoulensis]
MPHFHFGTHPDHGFVAKPTADITPHLADWFLVRLQFQPVPETPGLYRLTDPGQDGLRRARQAVLDLRRQGYGVRGDYALDPSLTPGEPQAVLPTRQSERRVRLAEAAAARTTQRGTAPTTAAASARTVPPRTASVRASLPSPADRGRSR